MHIWIWFKTQKSVVRTELAYMNNPHKTSEIYFFKQQLSWILSCHVNINLIELMITDDTLPKSVRRKQYGSHLGTLSNPFFLISTAILFSSRKWGWFTSSARVRDRRGGWNSRTLDNYVSFPLCCQKLPCWPLTQRRLQIVNIHDTTSFSFQSLWVDGIHAYQGEHIAYQGHWG